MKLTNIKTEQVCEFDDEEAGRLFLSEIADAADWREDGAQEAAEQEPQPKPAPKKRAAK